MPIVLTNQHLAELRNTKDYTKSIEVVQLYSKYRLKFPSVIKKYHDLLLFFCAFPSNKEIYDLAIAELKRIAATAKEIYYSYNIKTQKSLMGSGIAHTELFCSYSEPIAQWLGKKFPENIELGSSDASKDSIRNIIQSLAPSIEYQRSSQGELGLIARLKLTSGFQKPGDLLKWLLQLFEDCHLPNYVKEDMYQQLKVYIRWKLDNESFTRSFLRCPIKKLYYQPNILKKANSNFIVKQKLPKPVSLSPSGRTALLDVMRGSLAFQYRETDPVTYGDEKELELFELGRGLQIAVVGMVKEKRLSLESYVGYMAFKNGVPVSYGGGWIWGQRCKIGINIYPPFRRGESALIFCQVLRIYYNYFGARHFIVKPYQFGKGNPEGLKSGAFWFYYKLGFRPATEKIRIEAALEWEKIQTIKNYRTPLKLLQHFTSCHKEWILGKKIVPVFDAGKVSAAVTNMINRYYYSNRKQAIADSLNRIKKKLPVTAFKNIAPNELRVLENWSLLIELIGDMEEWNALQQRKLIRLVRLKQTGKERDYITRLQKHERLWKSLQRAIE